VEQKTAFLACQFHGIYSGLTWHLFEQWQNNLCKKDTLQMRPIQLDLVFPRADYSPSSPPDSQKAKRILHENDFCLFKSPYFLPSLFLILDHAKVST
jgi:hypothetical protein